MVRRKLLPNDPELFNEDGSRRFSFPEACSITGCSPGNLNAYIHRSPAVLTPAYEIPGSGKRQFFDFYDLVKLQTMVLLAPYVPARKASDMSFHVIMRAKEWLDAKADPAKMKALDFLRKPVSLCLTPQGEDWAASMVTPAPNGLLLNGPLPGIGVGIVVPADKIIRHVEINCMLVMRGEEPFRFDEPHYRMRILPDDEAEAARPNVSKDKPK